MFVGRSLSIAALISLGNSTQGFPREDIPEPPKSHILDQGKVFNLDATERLTKTLKDCAQVHEVFVFVFTVPTLAVMPSREREKLESLGRETTAAWTKDKVGAVIMFDDEAGWVTVGISDDAEKRFSSVAINMVIRNPLLETRNKRLSPAKLEAAAVVLVNGLTDLKLKSDERERHQKRKRIVFGAILLFALFVLILISFNRRTSSTA